MYAALAEKKKPDADGDGVPDWADKKPGEDDHADDEADIDEGAMSNIHAEIEAADDRAQATMELIDKGGPEGKYLYGELEKLAAKQGTTLSVDDEGSMPEDFIGDLLDDMGISAYKDEADTEDTSYSIKGKSEEANAELARIAELSGVSAPDEKADEDTSYSIKGKSEEANAELARIANVDEWETDPEEHNQAAIESWYDEVVSAITDRNITFPIADNEIQKIADDVVDDWSNGNGPDEHTILSIIDNENSQVNQDQKDEATLEHEATLEAIRNISFR